MKALARNMLKDPRRNIFRKRKNSKFPGNAHFKKTFDIFSQCWSSLSKKFYSREILPKHQRRKQLIQIFFALLYSISKISLRTSKAEMSLEPNRVSMMECFCENTVNFCKKCLIIDIRLGSQYASEKVFVISNIRKFCAKL